MYAIGGNPEAARLSGVRVLPLRVLGFVIVGVAGAVVGHPDHVSSAAPTRRTAATAYLLPAFAAVFLGAAVFRPGEFNVPGTVVGVLFLGVIQTGLIMLDFETYVINLVQGGILISAVLISRLGERSAGVDDASSTSSAASRSAGLVKTYPGVVALDGADLTILGGQILGLLGKNGAGKSTLIKVLAGVVQPDAGEIADRRRADDDPQPARGHRPRVRLRPPGAGRRAEPDGRRERAARARLPDTRGGLRQTSGDCARVRARCSTGSRPTSTRARRCRASASPAAAGDDRPRPGRRRAAVRPRRADRLADRRRDRAPAQGPARRCATTASRSIYVSHRLDEIFAITDGVTVMRDGAHRVLRPDRRASTRRELIDRDHGQRAARSSARARYRAPAEAPELLRVEGMTLAGGRRGRELHASRRRARSASPGSSAPGAPSSCG